MLLETPRLTLKPAKLDQFEQVYRLFSDPEVMRLMGGVHTREEVYEELQHMVSHFQKHGFSMGDVYEKASNQYVGQAGLCYFALDDTQPEIEVGYMFHQQFWNKGYATELTLSLLNWGFRYLPIHYLIAVTRPYNRKSCHVLEKAGMSYAGRMQCGEVELARYVIYKEDFKLL